MDKIGIITLIDYTNYGNRLQNYALSAYLEKQNKDVTTIRISADPRSQMRQFVSRQKSKLSSFFKNKQLNKLEKIKREKFINFTQKYIKETSEFFGLYDDLSVIEKNFDYFIIGSDQVWNPNFTYGSENFFAGFAERSKTVSYSASFGVSDIGDEYRDKYSKLLKNIGLISVREKAGANIVKSLTNRDVPVLIDPTMLLTQEEWRAIETKVSNEDEHYLLTYFLGGIPQKFKPEILRFAIEHNLKIVNLGDFSDSYTYVLDPSEFISYIDNATLFCTDSFHGAVFSILFETNFIVFERQGSGSMYSRIETLMNTFGLDDRQINSTSIWDRALVTDYSYTREKLALEREKAKDFLEQALPN